MLQVIYCCIFVTCIVAAFVVQLLDHDMPIARRYASRQRLASAEEKAREIIDEARERSRRQTKREALLGGEGRIDPMTKNELDKEIKGTQSGDPA